MTFNHQNVYIIRYIDYTLIAGKGVAMIDSFDLPGYQSMTECVQRGDIHINSVDVENPLDANEYTTIYTNPIQKEEDFEEN